jgi:hypothetical protein
MDRAPHRIPILVACARSVRYCGQGMHGIGGSHLGEVYGTAHLGHTELWVWLDRGLRQLDLMVVIALFFLLGSGIRAVSVRQLRRWAETPLPCHRTAEAHAKRRQIAKGNRTPGRHGIVPLRGQDLSTWRFASSGSHISIDSSSRNLHSSTRIIAATGRNKLGERSDAKDRVTPHWRRMGERHGTERLHMNVIMMTDERNQPGHLFTFDVSRQHLMHSRKARL